MPKLINSTPKADGFRMPGEFEKHEGIFMLWPERTDNWRNGAKPAQKAFVEVAEAIAEFEPVIMGVNAGQYDNARAKLSEKIRVVEISNDDSWARDPGATMVINAKGERRSVSWEFNAWGGLLDGLYFPWDKDNQVAEKFSNVIDRDLYKSDLILEGGSIHVDGDGTLYTTEACLLHESRNPDLTKEEIEAKLTEYLNLEKIIWLPNGVYLDETNEHVDNVLQVVEPGHVLLHWTDDETDEQYALSKAALDLLESSTDAKGRQIKVTKVPVPNPHILVTPEESEGVDAVEGTLPREAGDRQAASYINFLIVNGGVIIPKFGTEVDEEAKKIIQSVFPDRKVVQIEGAREIILGGGNIHCITQQF